MAITKAYYQEYKGTTRYFQHVYKFRDKNMIMTLVLKDNLRVLIVWWVDNCPPTLALQMDIPEL